MMDQAGHTIIIVDDDPENLRILGNLLKDDNYKVRSFVSGELALEAARRNPPDLIMLDIRMPDMDGFEVCVRLKETPQLSHIPVLFLSALDDARDIVKAFNLGGADYITKPFRYEEVQARVGAHLALVKTRKELEEEVVVRKRAQEDLTIANESLERRVAERTEELRTSEERYRTIVDTANEGVLTVGPDYRITYLNRKMAAMFNTVQESMVDTLVTDRFEGDNLRRYKARFDSRRGGKSETYEIQFMREDGKPFDAIVSEAPLHDASGAFSGAIAMVLDITDRKRAERELKGAYAEITQLKKQLEEHNSLLREEILSGHDFYEIVGQSEAIGQTRLDIDQAATSTAPVLITGEPGVGKELVARAIHGQGRLKDQPMIKVQCNDFGNPSDTPDSITASALSASSALATRIEASRGGTLYLHEIHSLSLDDQRLVLEVLEANISAADDESIRLIASTSRDLEAAVEADLFLDSLRTRLSVFTVHIPALRERMDDLESLVLHYLAKYAARHGKPVPQVPFESIRGLAGYEWPGNVRELAQLVERAVMASTGPALSLTIPTGPTSAGRPLKAVEKDMVLDTLEKTNWKINGPGGAAEILDMHPNSLRYRLKKWDISRPGKK